MTHIEEVLDFHPPPPPPAPPGLTTAWEAPKGLGILKEVNNTFIGALYIGTGMLFLVLGGVLALMIRYQLAFPGNIFLTEEQYNQVFTMHGTTMMFLFAVPIMEATSVWLLPLHARRPRPALSQSLGLCDSACYLFGGLDGLCQHLLVAGAGQRLVSLCAAEFAVLRRREQRFLAAGYRLHRDFGDRSGGRSAGRHHEDPRRRHVDRPAAHISHGTSL